MRARSSRCSRALLALALLAILAGAALAADASSSAPQAPSVKDSPGYVPLHDPDSLAEVLGRRPDAPKVKMEFHGGAKSLDALGREVCRAFHTGVPDSLLALCVRSDEFRVILWPEFPQSRPATGLRWDDAWQILWGRLNGGSVASVRENRDHVWTFLRITEQEVKRYNNFKLHNGIRLYARSDVGDTLVFDRIRSIAERKGRFKIYSMRD